jgi:hypothetical protein
MRWLQPGDVLLFNRDGLYNRIIRIKTWSRVSHVEVVSFASPVVGAPPLIVASRNSKGVAQYTIDTHGLYCVLRPRQPFDIAKAMEWFWSEANGQGYDWIGLLSFTSAKFQGKENGKMFCSEFAARFLRSGGIDPFLGCDADAVAPSDFLKNSAFIRIDISPSGV